MNSLFVNPPRLIQQIFSKRIWSKPSTENAVYLTFDDGPIPQVTPWVLETLKIYNAKATFFCIGDNIKKHLSLFAEILNNGHSIGNHTQHHLNGWKTNFEDYLKDVDAFEETIANSEFSSESFRNQNPEFEKPTISNLQSPISNLFRPPFGKMTSRQAKAVLKKGYKIIMWNALSRDYEANISEEKCLKNVLKNLQAGSIVVFHDSLKAEKNLRYTLPRVLKECKARNFVCKAL